VAEHCAIAVQRHHHNTAVHFQIMESKDWSTSDRRGSSRPGDECSKGEHVISSDVLTQFYKGISEGKPNSNKLL